MLTQVYACLEMLCFFKKQQQNSLLFEFMQLQAANSLPLCRRKKLCSQVRGDAVSFVTGAWPMLREAAARWRARRSPDLGGPGLLLPR